MKKSFIFSCIALTTIVLLWIFAVRPFMVFVTVARLETSPTVHQLRKIHLLQQKYKADYGRYGSLQDLAKAELIDAPLAAGTKVQNYVFENCDTSVTEYCIHANHQTNENPRNLNVTETGEVNFIRDHQRGNRHKSNDAQAIQ